MLSRKGGCGLRSVTPPCVVRAYDADDDDGGATAAVPAVSASACATPTADASYRRDPEYAQWWHHQRDKPARLLPPLVDSGNVLAVYCKEIRTGQPSPPPMPPPPPPPQEHLQQKTTASTVNSGGATFAPLQEPVYPAPIYEMEQHRLKHRCTVLSQRGAIVQHLPYNSSNEDDDTSSHNSSAVNSTAQLSASAYRPPSMRLETPTTPALEPTAAAAAAAPTGMGQVCDAGEPAQQWGYGGSDGRDDGLQAYGSGSYGSYYDYLFECECGTMTHSSLGYCSGCGFVPPPTGSGVPQQQSQNDVDDMLALRYADSSTSVLTCSDMQQPQSQPQPQQQQQPAVQQQQQQQPQQQQQQHLPAAPRQQPIILSPVQGTGNSGGGGGSARGSSASSHVKRHPAHGQAGGGGGGSGSSPRHYHPPHPAAARPISPCSSSLTASSRSLAYQRSSSSGCLSLCLDSMEGSTSFVSPNPTPTSTPQKVKVTVATTPPAAVPDLYNDDASPASPHGIEAYLGYY